MRPLTNETIEMARQGLLMSDWCGFSKRDTVNQLCDLALKGLTITRPEALSATPQRYDIDASVDWDGPEDTYAPAGLLDVYSSDHGEWVKWEDVQHLFAPSPPLRREGIALKDQPDDYADRIDPASACKHEWVSARNKVITSGEFCPKCHAVRAEP